jgi:hypothetical protein
MWDVRDAGGNLLAYFYHAADARAFVALPALIKAARVVLKFIEQDAMPNVAIEDDLRAALAQADGPAPKEQP